VIPLLRDKLIDAGVVVHIATAIYEEEIYQRNYVLWIALLYDGGGPGERCMVSAPTRNTAPHYLSDLAQTESEKFCQIWKNIYPNVVGVPNMDNFITSGMLDYYAFDYVPLDTPAVIVEHFNHTSPRGTYLKEHPELVAEGDFRAICKFLEIQEKPPITSDRYQIVYPGEVLQEYEYNPTDRIQELANDLETTKAEVAKLTDQNGTLKANLSDAENTVGTLQADLTRAQRERDDAKSALATAEGIISSKNAEIEELNEQIAEFKSSNPLEAYGWRELMSEAWKKFWKIKRG
jgi:hypothetical protein